MRRVQCDLAGHFRAVLGAEPPAREIAVSRPLPLHGDQTARQPSAEKPRGEKVVSLGQSVIGRAGRVGHGAVSRGTKFVSYDTNLPHDMSVSKQVIMFT